ncbi:hypothetical protein DF032_20610 [Burkholderia seminalis]|nr:hypothetical protein DF032_20610 [Burkholderia seminalis]
MMQKRALVRPFKITIHMKSRHRDRHGALFAQASTALFRLLNGMVDLSLQLDRTEFNRKSLEPRYTLRIAYRTTWSGLL